MKAAVQTLSIITPWLSFPLFELRNAADVANGLKVPIEAFIFFRDPDYSDLEDCIGFLISGPTLVALLDKTLREKKRHATAQLLKRCPILKERSFVFIPRGAAHISPSHRLEPKKYLESINVHPDLYGSVIRASLVDDD